MKVSVLLFAAVRETAGRDSIELLIPDAATVGDLQAALLRELPPLATQAGILLWAVNNDYATRDRILHGTDVVACFPPVSGG